MLDYLNLINNIEFRFVSLACNRVLHH